MTGKSALTLSDVFWPRVEIHGPNKCWPWTGAVNGGIQGRGGYGQLAFQGRKLSAHRTAFQLVRGPIPDGKSVCHHCDNRRCCNPAHLFLGTAADNQLDAVRKGRIPRGRKHWNSKLDEGDIPVVRARLAEGFSQRQVARMFDVHPGTIQAIADGRTWAHV